MSVSIRLQRHGKTHYPFYHIVAADSRKARNGRFIERLGYYNPNCDPSEIVLKADRIQHWYECGAQLSPTVKKLVKTQKLKLERKKTQKTSS